MSVQLHWTSDEILKWLGYDDDAPPAECCEVYREALRRVQDLICGTASIILMPGQKMLDDSVSASVVTNAEKAMLVIAAVLEGAKKP